MKKENEKKINDTELENVSGGYDQQLSISPNYGTNGETGYTRTTTLNKAEALTLYNAGEYGNPNVEETLRQHGFNRESTSINRLPY